MRSTIKTDGELEAFVIICYSVIRQGMIRFWCFIYFLNRSNQEPMMMNLT